LPYCGDKGDIAMVTVNKVIVSPAMEGGEIRADMTIGQQELSTSCPIDGQDSELSSLLDRMSVRVQHVTYQRTPSGIEIRANMTVGEREFVSRLVVEGEDQVLATELETLLEQVGVRCIHNLQAALASDANVESGPGSNGPVHQPYAQSRTDRL